MPIKHLIQPLFVIFDEDLNLLHPLSRKLCPTFCVGYHHYGVVIPCLGIAKSQTVSTLGEDVRLKGNLGFGQGTHKQQRILYRDGLVREGMPYEGGRRGRVHVKLNGKSFYLFLGECAKSFRP